MKSSKLNLKAALIRTAGIGAGAVGANMVAPEISKLLGTTVPGFVSPLALIALGNFGPNIISKKPGTVHDVGAGMIALGSIALFNHFSKPATVEGLGAFTPDYRIADVADDTFGDYRIAGNYNEMPVMHSN